VRPSTKRTAGGFVIHGLLTTSLLQSAPCARESWSSSRSSDPVRARTVHRSDPMPFQPRHHRTKSRRDLSPEGTNESGSASAQNVSPIPKPRSENQTPRKLVDRGLDIDRDHTNRSICLGAVADQTPAERVSCSRYRTSIKIDRGHPLSAPARPLHDDGKRRR
jgi:hypothetical protein